MMPFAARRLVASVGVLVAFLSPVARILPSEFSFSDFDMVYAITLLSILDLIGLATL
jgi:hypothetical protein